MGAASSVVACAVVEALCFVAVLRGIVCRRAGRVQKCDGVVTLLCDSVLDGGKGGCAATCVGSVCVVQEQLRKDATAFWKRTCRMDAMLSFTTPESRVQVPGLFGQVGAVLVSVFCVL